MYLCLAVNAVMLGAVAASHPTYLLDERESGSPDARHYFVLGRNIVSLGEFSGTQEPPMCPICCARRSIHCSSARSMPRQGQGWST